MGVLGNAKHEQVARLVAGGASAQDAYLSAYPGSKGAAQSASRLLRTAKVRSRVAELAQASAEEAVKDAAMSKAWVLDRLKRNVVWCESIMESTAPDGSRRFAGNVLTRTLELIGRELGMFRAQLEVTGNVDLVARLAAGRERARQAKEQK